MRVACSKRTSAIVGSSYRYGVGVDGCHLAAQNCVRVGPRVERVETEQRGAEHRGRRRRTGRDRRSDLGEPGADRGTEPRIGTLEETAAEQHLDGFVLQPEARDRHARERDDLRREPVDDRRSDGVMRRLGEDEWRELDRARAVDAPEMNRLRELERRRQPEVRRDALLEARLRAAPVLAARRRVYGFLPDVAAAAPVARGPAERGEPRVRAVRRDADTVDSGAADDGDPPATVGAGAQDGKR